MKLDSLVSRTSANRLRTFKQDVEQAFPGQLDRVLLFGSRARGEATSGSDYDVAVVFFSATSIAGARPILSDIAFRFVRVGTPIRPIAICANDVSLSSVIPVARNIARDGVVIQ